MEEKPNFVMKGENNEGNFVVIPERFFGISSRPRKVVILGFVKEGEIKEGDKFSIESLGGEKKIPETVKRIERNNKSIPYAVKGEPVGIQLSKTNIKVLRKFNSGY